MPLVVRPDRGKVRRWLTLILVLNGSIAAVALGAALWATTVTSVGAVSGLPFAITLTGCVFQMVFHAYFYGRMMGMDTLAEVGPQGLTGRTAKGEVAHLPWAAVASVSHSWNTFVVRPHPGAGPKLVIPTRAIDSDATTIRSAVRHFSGGRL